VSFFDLWPVIAAFAELQHLYDARPCAPIFTFSLFLGRDRAPKHEQLANVLHRRGAERVGQLGKHRFARGAVVAEDAHLDQTMGIECSVGFLAHGGGQAVAADSDHRVEVVRGGAVFASLGGGQNEGGHTRIIRSP
jgi:hypothetical protein